MITSLAERRFSVVAKQLCRRFSERLTAARWLAPAMLLVTLVAVRPVRAAAAAGDAEARKIVDKALEHDYLEGDFDIALQKLNGAHALCESKGCTPAVHAQVFGAIAIVRWEGVEDHAAATEELRTMVRYDPTYRFDGTYASPGLLAAADAVRADAKRGGAAGAGAPAASAKPAPPSEEARKQEEFQKQVEARKAAQIREAEESLKAAQAAEAKRVAEEKKEAERKAAEEKKEAARKAAEEKKEAARKAAEEKKAEQARKIEAAKKAAEDKREAARRAAEEKKEAARRAAEEKKEAIKRAAEEAARKAEEARLAKEDKRMRTPPPVGVLQETVWREQTVNYPIPIFVKVPPPPANIERPRVEVVKVIAEYSAPGVALPQQIELKPLPSGGYGGLLPCEASSQEGEVTYFTTALNKYEIPVARGASAQKPNAVKVKTAFVGKFPSLPGDMPPAACDEKSGAKTQQASCDTNSDCPDGGTCSKDGCTPAVNASAPAVVKAKRGGCAGCNLAHGEPIAPAAAVALGVLGATLIRRRRRAALR